MQVSRKMRAGPVNSIFVRSTGGRRGRRRQTTFYVINAATKKKLLLLLLLLLLQTQTGIEGHVDAAGGVTTRTVCMLLPSPA